MSAKRASVPDEPLLEATNVTVEFPTDNGMLRAVDDVSVRVFPGEIVGIVGESGSGKSVLLRALMNMVTTPGRITTGRIRLGDIDILRCNRRELEQVRGQLIGLIPPDPGAALNPVARIGRQAAEGLVAHGRGATRIEQTNLIVGELAKCGLPEARHRLRQYPHELSGGMQQRVAIAMATQMEPRIILADEPTTALDVTVQAQVLTLLRQICDESGSSILFVSHDITVISSLCDRVVVMYAGQVLEEGPAEQMSLTPRHPYTRALWQSVPPLGGARPDSLVAIPGGLPDAPPWPTGCRFAERCGHRDTVADPERCTTRSPIDGRMDGVACHFPLHATASAVSH